MLHPTAAAYADSSVQVHRPQRRVRAEGDGFSLGRFPEISADELAYMIRLVHPRFVEQEFPLSGERGKKPGPPAEEWGKRLL